MKTFALVLTTLLLGRDADAGWSFLSGEGPLRHTYASAYDSARGRLLLFGGSDGQAYRQETFVLDLATSAWSELSIPGEAPSPRRLVEGIYDPVGDRFIVFGGLGDDGFHADLWALSLAGSPAWTRLNPRGPAPSPRAGHTVVYDAHRHRMIVFGGFDPAHPGHFRNDLWVLSLEGRPAWRRLSTPGLGPGPCSSHSAVYDAALQRMLVFDGGGRNDVWELSLQGAPRWTRIASAGEPPAPREEQAAVYDPVRRRLVIHGGYFDVFGAYFDDTWSLSLTGVPTWTELVPTEPRPGARWGHGAIYDPSGDRMILHGGQLGLNDTWALALEAP